MPPTKTKSQKLYKDTSLPCAPHVKELSQKNYAQHSMAGRKQLDFVVMYLFSESALSLALNAEPTLWKEAYDKGVFITSSQNLYALLRMLEMSWTQQRQNGKPT